MTASTGRLGRSREDRVPPLNAEPPIREPNPHGRVFVLLNIAVVGLAVLPGVVNYLNVKHLPLAGTLERFPFAQTASIAAAAVLALACSVILVMRGHPDRNVSGALILLLALAFPYIISPTMPTAVRIAQVTLGAAVILAVWNIGPSVDGLKWVAISGSFVGTFSLIGGLVVPKHMMYEMDSPKALVGHAQLAGPFVHSNILGLYCVLALALTPLIVRVPWRVINGLILCAAIAASASRTAVVAAGVLALWWILCRFRSVISVRLAGSMLIGACAATVLVLPLLSWSPQAFTYRAYIWEASLSAWQESRVVGLGINWFASLRSSEFVIGDDSVKAGHNLVIDTLVTTGIVGICVLVLMLLAALRSSHALEVTNHQIACLGYLIVFLVASATEAIWSLLPNAELFPVVGLVFTVLIAMRGDLQVARLDSQRPPERFAVHSQNLTPSRMGTSLNKWERHD